MSSLTQKTCAPAPLRAELGTVLQQALRAARITLKTWIKRSRDRRDLREMEEHLLRDVGISRGQANFEGNKPFWRA
ncbi:DUF1127 domain-containing protein [Denitromonas iodatirespirans]|uniref:DUF1127 domain-containing protein n=1 Tax=Denitromonas iodatirespirans TaxID=2795389 RepID=A0A944DC20_DENI1|nr:DUF1127 domain-containing protein [Denitromonas iodatirespirans]MBT0964035.1 DUF1127 domain-containing protein [Denitromonas iodatirespirans]